MTERLKDRDDGTGWGRTVRRKAVKHLKAPLFAVHDTCRGENAEMFGGRLKGEVDFFGDIADICFFLFF